MARSEKVSYWRGKSKTLPTTGISGRILFEEDTGNVYLEYNNFNTTTNAWEISRRRLTDTDKFNISGGSFTGPVYLVQNPALPLEAATKKYVDDVDEKASTHINNSVIHITNDERFYWNNKVDQVEEMGLSHNDFTDSYKQKLEDVSEDATSTSFVPIQTDGVAIGTITIDSRSYTIYAPEPHDITGNASTADELKTTRYIDGVGFDGSYDIVHYTQCSSFYDDPIKSVYLADFLLDTGSRIYVEFINENEADNVQLKVNDYDPYPITYGGSQEDVVLKTGTYCFIVSPNEETDYCFEMVRAIDTNNVYTLVTTENNGLMRANDYETFLEIRDIIEDIEGQFHLVPATKYTLGGVIVGEGLSVEEDGLVSIDIDWRNDLPQFEGAIDSSSGETTSIIPNSQELSIEDQSGLDPTYSFDSEENEIVASLFDSESVGLVDKILWSREWIGIYDPEEFSKLQITNISQMAVKVDFEGMLIDRSPDPGESSIQIASGATQTLNVYRTSDPETQELYENFTIKIYSLVDDDNDLQTLHTSLEFKDIPSPREGRDGEAGIVPAPMEGQATYYLCGDGTWEPFEEFTDEEINTILDGA